MRFSVICLILTTLAFVGCSGLNVQHKQESIALDNSEEQKESFETVMYDAFSGHQS